MPGAVIAALGSPSVIGAVGSTLVDLDDEEAEEGEEGEEGEDDELPSPEEPVPTGRVALVLPDPPHADRAKAAAAMAMGAAVRGRTADMTSPSEKLPYPGAPERPDAGSTPP
ncbi:MAG: hypothetical protein IPK37_03915 [Austwickia sp.]|nr:MAG: hypothetical protein IPK37_03915 [Austwickia sp.]